VFVVYKIGGYLWEYITPRYEEGMEEPEGTKDKKEKKEKKEKIKYVKK
jgi:hypothetical protein